MGNGASAAACAIGISPVSKCDLCELRDYTQRYCEFVHPFKFTILDCDSCDTPMAVLGEHRTAATEAEKALMVEVLSTVARDKWGADGFFIDDVMRQIPDHCHIHARRRGRWGLA
jgi:hypothetical protein